MKYIYIPTFCIALLLFSSCKKDNNNSSNSGAATELQVLTDFANVLVNPNYQDIQAKANLLNTAVQTLSTNTTQANLDTARSYWRITRTAWEQAEGYLFGPVEDYNFDPTMDTWPLSKVELDSLLASNNPLNIQDIESLPYSLKGFHAIEYLIFGVGGSKKPENIASREKQYLITLTQNLYNTTVALQNSWNTATPNNFTNLLINAGTGSTRFTTRKDAFLAIVTAMAGICDEVADGKMNDPLVAQDSSLEESQFSHNSTLDFKNNITGALNAYLCKYTTDGHGLNELVAAKNISLDNTIKSQFNAAIASFNAISSNYGQAIFTQKVQIHNTQNLIHKLKSTLENDLTNFIQTNIKD